MSDETNFRSTAERVPHVLGFDTDAVNLAKVLTIWDKFTASIGFSLRSRSRSPLTGGEFGWEVHSDRLDIMDKFAHPAFLAA